MNYYIADISIQQDNHDHMGFFRFAAEDEGMASEIHEYTAGNWFGRGTMKWDRHEGLYYYNSNIAVRRGIRIAISEATFNELATHLNFVDMTVPIEEISQWRRSRVER